jgi:plasmid maintenance system killer protein
LIGTWVIPPFLVRYAFFWCPEKDSKFKQYPERVTPSAWCSECGRKVELDNAVLVYDAEGLELCVLDKECCVDYLKRDEFSCILLRDISSVILENLVEKDGFSKYDVEELEKQLKLWGIISLNNDKGTIYFIKSDETKEIKIGYTSGEVEKRLKTLQTGHPHKLQVLATMPGSRDEEKTLHEKFASIRLNGEWFKPHPDLLDFIATVKKL